MKEQEEKEWKLVDIRFLISFLTFFLYLEKF
jgi:hypothetical protein